MSSNIRVGRNFSGTLVLAGLSVLIFQVMAWAQAGPPPPAAAASAGMNLTATSANVSDAGGAVRINLARWSTDEERNAMVNALSPPAAAAAPAAAGAAPAAGRGGRGAAAAPTGPVDPIVALSAAIQKAQSLGVVWTTESLGYSIKYAFRAAQPDGTERIVLAVDRRLGSTTPGAWKPAAPATPTNYDFTVIELKLDPKGVSEGKASINTKVTVDAAAKTITLDGYATAPAVLRNVKR